MDKQTYEQLDRIEGIIREIGFELGIFDSEGTYIKKEDRDNQNEEEEEIPRPPKEIFKKNEGFKTSVKNKKTGFEDEEEDEEYNEEDK